MSLATCRRSARASTMTAGASRSSISTAAASTRCWPCRRSGARSEPRLLRHHGAIEGLGEGLNEIVGRLRRDVETGIVVGETARIDDALFAGPGEALGPVADDMDGKLRRGRMQLLAERAGRAAAGLLAIGDDDDHTRLAAVVEHIGRLLHGGGKRRAAGGRE